MLAGKALAARRILRAAVAGVAEASSITSKPREQAMLARARNRARRGNRQWYLSHYDDLRAAIILRRHPHEHCIARKPVSTTSWLSLADGDASQAAERCCALHGAATCSPWRWRGRNNLRLAAKLSSAGIEKDIMKHRLMARRHLFCGNGSDASPYKTVAAPR